MATRARSRAPGPEAEEDIQELAKTELDYHLEACLEFRGYAMGGEPQKALCSRVSVDDAQLCPHVFQAVLKAKGCSRVRYFVCDSLAKRCAWSACVTRSACV